MYPAYPALNLRVNTGHSRAAHDYRMVAQDGGTDAEIETRLAPASLRVWDVVDIAKRQALWNAYLVTAVQGDGLFVMATGPLGKRAYVPRSALLFSPVKSMRGHVGSLLQASTAPDVTRHLNYA